MIFGTLLGVFKPDALHLFIPVPIKALPCLCVFTPVAEKSKQPDYRWLVTQEKLFNLPHIADAIILDIDTHNRPVFWIGPRNSG